MEGVIFMGLGAVIFGMVMFFLDKVSKKKKG